MALAQELEFRVTLALTLTFNFCSEQLGGDGGLEIEVNYILQVDRSIYINRKHFLALCYDLSHLQD